MNTFLHAEGRKKKESRHGEAGQYFKQCDQRQIRMGAYQCRRADVDADDAEHADAAHVIDRLYKWF